MALIRGFSRVEDDGKIAIPTNIQRYAELMPEYPVEFAVMRVKDTARRPHIYFFRPDHAPYPLPMEVMVMEGATVMNEEGKIILDHPILEEAKLEPGHLVEMKVAGSRGVHWVVTLQSCPLRPWLFPGGETGDGQKASDADKRGGKEAPVSHNGSELLSGERNKDGGKTFHRQRHQDETFHRDGVG